MNNLNNIYERLLNYADNMKIIDTHEYLNLTKNYVGDEPDVLCDYLSHDISTGLLSAGLNREDFAKIRDYKVDIINRFKILEPYLECVKNTLYYRSLELSAKKIHGINEISIKTIEELNSKFKKTASRADYGNYIMKDLCNIESVINNWLSDDMNQVMTDLLVYSWNPKSFTFPDIKAIRENGLDFEKLSLDEYCEEYKQHFLTLLNKGVKTIKISMAYEHSLYIEDIDYNSAKKLYSDFVKKYKELKKGEVENFQLKFDKKLQDYMLHFVLKIANENNFIVQIETGIQDETSNSFKNIDSMITTNLFEDYSNLTFDIFYTGYHYGRRLINFAKTYANVYIGLCWANIISLQTSANAFYEMLNTPRTKVFGFGGGCGFYDGVAGHLILAKQKFCKELSQKVCNGECDIDTAENFLQSVLYDNAKRTFKL